MNVAMMQPTFLPWQGFFELVLKSDIFILLDDFQFSVQSYHQRNRLFVNKDQVGWYTVPVKKEVSFQSPLNRVHIEERASWRIKMWKRIQMNYSRAPYYKDMAPWIESWLMRETGSIASLNIAFIKYVMELMDYEGELRYSSALASQRTRSARVEELLNWCGANAYYSAKGSFEYMLEDRVFPLPDLPVYFQDFYPLPYNQIGSKQGFIPYLSILDALMNIGVQSTKELIIRGTEHWIPWADMVLMGNR